MNILHYSVDIKYFSLFSQYQKTTDNYLYIPEFVVIYKKLIFYTEGSEFGLVD